MEQDGKEAYLRDHLVFVVQMKLLRPEKLGHKPKDAQQDWDLNSDPDLCSHVACVISSN